MTMGKATRISTSQRGVMLIEALLAILIFSIGILAIVGMQSVAVKDVTQSKHRSEASFLVNELMAQIWVNAGNVSSYAYPGSGTPPAVLNDWIGKVNQRLPGSTVTPPKVTMLTVPTGQGATVKIEVFWRLPEEVTLGMPAHNYTTVASVFTNAP
jgi:type IV pilus assembly protein PilV